MVFTTGLRSTSENYCDVKLTRNPCGLKKKKPQRTDKFDPMRDKMRDKNDLKERLGQRWDKTTHSKSLILKILSRQSEFTKMHVI